MKYSELIKQNRIKAGKFSPEQVKQCVEIANRDTATSKSLQKENTDWAYNIAYNAMLQAGRAFMFSKGYRPSGEAQHAAVIEFLRLALDKSFKEKLDVMDIMRRKRNKAVYDSAGLVSETEVKDAVKNAGEFVAAVLDVL